MCDYNEAEVLCADAQEPLDHGVGTALNSAQV